MKTLKKVGAGLLSIGVAAGLSLAVAAPAQATTYAYKTVYLGSLGNCWGYSAPSNWELTWDCHYVANVNGGSWAKDYRIPLARAVGGH